MHDRVLGPAANTVISLSNLTIENGLTASGGSGIYIPSGCQVTLTNCTLSHNDAGVQSAAAGLYTDVGGTATLTNCALTSNSGTVGAGGFFNAGTMTLTNCLLNGNTGQSGAGFENVGTATLTGCALMGNAATQNGGGFWNDSSLTLTNCLLVANASSGSAGGGGGYSEGSSARVTLTNCTLTASAAATGFGGGLNIAGGMATLTNDIFWGDSASGMGEIAAVPGSTVVTNCDVQGGYAGTGNINADPLFVSPSAPYDLHLQRGTPCVNQGTVTAPAYLSTDKDGRARPNPPTLGAYEAPSVSTGNTQLLWRHAPDGQAAFWELNPHGTYAVALYGPFAGWTAQAVAEAPDGTNWLLWSKTDGTAALWHVTSLTSTGYTYHLYGPYAGYSAVSLSVGADGSPHILWDKTDGATALWTVNPTNATFTYALYGPYPGWTAKAVASGATVTDLLWTKTDGTASGYRIAANGSLTYHLFGPYAGYAATSLSVGPDDGAHLLWDNKNGAVALWNVDFTSGAFSYTPYGPFSGWSAQAIATGPDNVTHLLWDKTDGTTALWAVTGSGFTYATYGPFAGWTAVAVSAGT